MNIKAGEFFIQKRQTIKLIWNDVSRYFSLEGRNIWICFIILAIYIFLLISHALWDYIPDSWNEVYKQTKFPSVPLPRSEFSSSDFPYDVTVVTGYFYLGVLRKGPEDKQTPEQYKKWMSTYSYLNNSVIVFTDSADISAHIKSIRLMHFPEKMTQVYIVQRDDFWAFKLAPKIKDVYSKKGYPTFPPNTVNWYYSCAMHVKYDLMEIVIKEKMHKTRYLAWVDIGYFREEEQKSFKLLPPVDMKEGHIAYTQMKPFFSDMTPKEIIYTNSIWIAGGFFIGKPEYLITMIEDYKTAVEMLISDSLMSTDQQVLFIMYSPKYRFNPRVPVQTIYHRCRCHWFFMGELCRDAYNKKFRPFYPLVQFHNHVI